jgi:hypothetical protein
MRFEEDDKILRAEGLSEEWEVSAERIGSSYLWSVHYTPHEHTVTWSASGAAWNRDDAVKVMETAYTRLLSVHGVLLGAEPAPGELEIDRDEWKAKAEAFGQKAHQLQEQRKTLAERVKAVSEAWNNIGDSRGPSEMESRLLREAIDAAVAEAGSA